MATIPSALIGIAGVHFVAAELSRRGLIALPTVRNTAGFDIIVATADGAKHANIQVKTSQKKVTFFPMPSAEKVRTGPKDYYVLLRWLPKEKRFEGFMLRGKEAKAEVMRHEARLKRAGRHNPPMPFVSVDETARKADKHWKRRWESWRL